jgi:hypothetical protein
VTPAWARAAGIGLIALAACAPVAPSPDEQIEVLLDELQQASRTRDLKTLKARISERYTDAAARGKPEIEGLINAYYLRGSAVYLLLRLRELEVTDDELVAGVQVLAAMARVPLEDWTRIRESQADLYVFDLDLAQEEPGIWRVTRAGWEPATFDDLL